MLQDSSSIEIARPNGQVSFERVEEVDCTKLLGQVLDELEKEVQKTVATVEFGKLPVVKGYPVELRRLFKELIQNALRFRKEGVAPHIQVSARMRNGTTEFSVRDNGMGIDPAKQEKIFNPFFKLNPALEGEGMGLAICKRIAQLHGGDIQVKSKNDEGCTFVFTVSDKIT